MPYIIYPHETNRTDLLGGKAGALAALAQTELPIPAWLVLSPEAFEASLSQAQCEAKLWCSIRPCKPNWSRP
jgi:phosphoenolpyruvate synthase/pyruvate phosphate dikinase